MCETVLIIMDKVKAFMMISTVLKILNIAQFTFLKEDSKGRRKIIQRSNLRRKSK